MPEVGINHFILLSAILLGLGIYLAVSSKHKVKIVTGIAILFTASLINLAAFSGVKNFNPEGQIILFVIGAICLLIIFTGCIIIYNNRKITATEESK